MSRSTAEIVREYGPFPGADNVHGVTYDGRNVWFASGDRLNAFDPASGKMLRSIEVAAHAGTAFDGQHLFQLAEDRIQKIDPKTGRVLATIPAPGGGGDSGLTWAEGTLWVGHYRDRKIHQIDPETGAILRTIESNRFVTGVTWVDGELWHGTWEGDESEIRRISPESGAVLERLEMPWVRIDKAYRFETDEGTASLADLFRGRSQLLVYHFMFGPDYTAGCPACSAIADGFDGFVAHLANHDVTLSAVSRAPLAKLQAYKRRMGWTFPWASSLGSDFNFDFNVSLTEEQQREGAVEYNYRREAAWTLRGIGDSLTKLGQGPVAEIAAMTGTDVVTYTRERPGMSAFVLEDGTVYHTYSAYARGLDGLWGAYQVARPRPQGPQRASLLVASPRRVRQALSLTSAAEVRRDGPCRLVGGFAQSIASRK